MSELVELIDKDIKKILKGYEELYAPWEMEESPGDCQQYTEIGLIKFGRQMYELGLLNKNGE